MNLKKSYFQGGGSANEPTPKKSKYKKEELNQDDTKARDLFFKNYDLYDTDDSGPGTGFYQKMPDYKSVDDFRKKNIKKRRKAFFEAILFSLSSFDINNLADPEKDESLTPPLELWNPAPPEGSPIGLNDDSSSELDYQDEPSGNLYYGIMENHNIQ